jgi:hypothetical protein
MGRGRFDPLPKRAIIGTLLVLVGLLAGCSTLQWGYRQAPTLAYWWLDRQFGFDAAQEPLVRESLADFQRWHQQTQLSAYVALLTRARAQLLETPAPSADQMCRLADEARLVLAPALDHALPAAARVLGGLGPQQRQRWLARQTERTQELREEWWPAGDSRTAAARAAQREAALAATARRQVERLEGFYGPLSAAQRRLVAEWAAGRPDDAEDRLAERVQRLQTLRAILEAAPSADARATEQALAQWLRRMDGRLPPSDAGQAQRVAARRQAQCALAAQVHASADAEQREHLAAKLEAWQNDLLALSAQPATPAVQRSARAGQVP